MSQFEFLHNNIKKYKIGFYNFLLIMIITVSNNVPTDKQNSILVDMTSIIHNILLAYMTGIVFIDRIVRDIMMEINMEMSEAGEK